MFYFDQGGRKYSNVLSTYPFPGVITTTVSTRDILILPKDTKHETQAKGRSPDRPIYKRPQPDSCFPR